MLRCHEGARFTRRINRPLHDALCAPRVVGRLLRGQDVLKTVPLPNHLLCAVVVHAEFIQCLGGNRIAHVQNTEQQLAGTDIPLAAPLCNILRKLHGLNRRLRKKLTVVQAVPLLTPVFCIDLKSRAHALRACRRSPPRSVPPRLPYTEDRHRAPQP